MMPFSYLLSSSEALRSPVICLAVGETLLGVRVLMLSFAPTAHGYAIVPLRVKDSDHFDAEDFQPMTKSEFEAGISMLRTSPGLRSNRSRHLPKPLATLRRRRARPADSPLRLFAQSWTLGRITGC